MVTNAQLLMVFLFSFMFWRWDVWVYRRSQTQYEYKRISHDTLSDRMVEEVLSDLSKKNWEIVSYKETEFGSTAGIVYNITIVAKRKAK